MSETTPQTPFEVEREMVELNHRIMNAPNVIRDFHNKAREAEKTYKMAYNVALLRADGTQAEKKAYAELETQEQRDAWEIAKVEYKYVQDVLNALKAKQRGLQSISSLMKASMFSPQGGI